jgi:hypothetical protein
MSISTETIKKRVSVRTFNKEKLKASVIEEIRSYISNISNPFGIPIEFQILDAKQNNLSSAVIIGGDTYVAAKYKKAENAEVAYGYTFEKFILYATSLGVGTVWLAATIDRNAFEKAVDLKEDEVLPVVSPIGYAASERSIRESIIRIRVKSDERFPFDKIFFKGDFKQGLQESDAGDWLLPLQMVRLAPSATNKQPWRLIVDGNRVHFYEEKTKGYANEKSGDMQKIDLGIAICHFEIAVNEQGLKGKFIKKNPEIALPENTEYIITYELEG